MQYRNLGNSGLIVSVLGLGCNNFGGRMDLEHSRAVVDSAIDFGVTFLDTADIYGNLFGNIGGSEIALGELLSGKRDEVVLATKFGFPGATWVTAEPLVPRVAESTFDEPWKNRSGVCALITSTSTSSTARTRPHQCSRRLRPCTSSYWRGRSGTSGILT